MSKKRNFVDAYNNGTLEEQKRFQMAMKKRRKIWGILSFIPVINWITGPCFIATNNTIRKIEGKKVGGLANFGVVIMCLVIFAYPVGWILEHSYSIGCHALGVSKLLKVE